MPTFRQLANVFIRYANATFGGGSATTAVLHRAIVDERGWVASERFAVIYALARLTRVPTSWPCALASAGGSAAGAAPSSHFSRPPFRAR